MNHEDLDQMVERWVSTRETQTQTKSTKTNFWSKGQIVLIFADILWFQLENCGNIIYYDGMGRRNELNSIKLEIEKVVEYVLPVRG